MDENIKICDELEIQSTFNMDSINDLLEDCEIENEEVIEDEN